MLTVGHGMTVTTEVLFKALLQPGVSILMLISESVTSSEASVTSTVAIPPVRYVVLVVAPPLKL